MSGVDTSDFTLKRIGTINGTIASVSGSGTTYDVTVNGLTGAGVLRLDLKFSGTGIIDTSSNPITTGFFTGQSYQVGTTAVASWGGNSSGQLGNNSTTSSAVPGTVLASGVLIGRTIVALASGAAHSVALADNGALYSWGSNRLDFFSSGQLGNGGTASSSAPVAVDTSGVLVGKSVIAIASGEAHTLALTVDGRVYSWGAGVVGQLGNGGTTNSSIPVAVDTSGVLNGKTVIAIAAGSQHSLALTSEGLVYAWGRNAHGELGDGTNTLRTVPVAVSTSGVLTGKPVVAIAAGFFCSFAITSDGQLYAWGDNDYGELGNSTITEAHVPVAVNTAGGLGGKTIVAVVAGSFHAIALSADNALFSWGSNNFGQLGNGIPPFSTVPVSVSQSGALSGKTIASIANGSTTSGDHSLVLSSDGQVFAWGYNNSGQLGNNSTTDSASAVAVNASATLSGMTVFSLAAGSDHSLAAFFDGTPPAIIGISSPVAGNYIPGAPLDFTLTFSEPVIINSRDGSPNLSITVGSTSRTASYLSGSGSAALVFRYTVQAGDTDPDGITLRSPVGLNGGTIRDAAGNDAVLSFTPPNLSAVIITSGDFIAPTVISVTSSTPNGTKVVGTAISIQINFSEAVSVVDTPQLTLAVGLANRAISYVSGSGSSSLTFTYVVAPGDFSDDLDYVTTNSLSLNGGSIQDAAHNNADLTLPDPGTAGSLAGTSSLVIDGVPPRVTTINRQSPATLTSGGTSVVYRVNFSESVTGVDVSDFILKSIGTVSGTIASISGSGMTYDVTVNGLTGAGVLRLDLKFSGTGIVDASSTPISTGFFTGQTYQVGATTVASWGQNSSGQLGNNSTTSSSRPVAVLASGALSGKTVVAVAGGTAHSVALAHDGTLYTWGSNRLNAFSSGQLGNGGTSDSPVPVAVDTSGVLAGKSVIAIACGEAHTLALTADGRVYSWGAGFAGQLGNGGTTNSSVPVAVDISGVLNGKTVIAIAAGLQHSLALTSEGLVYAWGRNTFNGISTTRTVPVDVSTSSVLGGRPVVAIAACNSRSFAITSDGHLYAWGFNTDGALGDGSTTDTNVPVAVNTEGVLGGKTIVAVASGNSHALALSSDNMLFSWGSNNFGQLGTGVPYSVVPFSKVPVSVSQSGALSSKTIANIGSTNNGNHLLVLSSDGQVFAWGYNNSGQLGNNSTTDSASAVAVNASATLSGMTVFSLAAGSDHSLATISDITPPAAPLISTFNSDTGTSSTDGVTADRTLVFSGTAEPGATVTLSQTGVGVIGTAIATGAGAWSYDYTAVTLPVGAYFFTAVATDAAGNTSPISAAFAVTIQDAPTIVTPPTGGTFVANDSFTMTVIAGGSPPFTYQWYRDGVALADFSNRSGSTTASVTHTAIGTVGFDGSYTVTVTNASGSVTSPPAIVVVNKANQTLTFPPIGDRTVASGPINVSATASSGLVVTFSIVFGPALISGNTVTPTGTGLIVVRASQNGDINYNPVSVDQSFAVQKSLASIAISNLAQTYDGIPHSVTTVTMPPGLAVNTTYNGNPLPPTSAGYYLVSAAIDDSHYIGSQSATLTIAKATQTIAFGSAPATTVGKPITLQATASSGLPITFSIVSGNATLSAATVTPNDSNPVVVRATQAGNENYLSISSEQIVTASRSAQTIAFAPLGDVIGNSAPFALTATASSGLPVAFVIVTGPASIKENVLSLTGAPGTVTVRATQPGNSAYAEAPVVEQSFTVTAPSGRIFLGDLISNNGKSGDVGAVVSENGRQASLLIVAPSFGVNTLFDVAIDADGGFLATGVMGAGAQASLKAAPAIARAPVTLTLSGTIRNGRLSGTLSPVGLSFNVIALASSDGSTDFAGFYKASALGTANGATYSVIGTNNQILVLGTTMDLTVGGLTTVGPDGSFSVSAGTATLSGAISSVHASLNATLHSPDRSDITFSGLSSTAVPTDRFVNLSSRMRIGTGDHSLIAGFVVSGATSQQIVVRGIGPTLGSFGVQDPMANPLLTVLRGSDIVAENDDWSSGTSSTLAATFARLGAFPLPSGSRDAALAVTLAPGAYTVRVDGGSGVGLVEIYDAGSEPQEQTRVMNLSTRGDAGDGEAALISGFVVAGNAPRKILVRGIGPGLTAFGVSGALADPKLRIFHESILVAQNDNWSDDPTEAEAISDAAQVNGAFALTKGSRDAALMLTLSPGTYSAQVTGPNNSAPGIALIEIYDAGNP